MLVFLFVGLASLSPVFCFLNFCYWPNKILTNFMIYTQPAYAAPGINDDLIPQNIYIPNLSTLLYAYVHSIYLGNSIFWILYSPICRFKPIG